jgi:hypothetical protein
MNEREYLRLKGLAEVEFRRKIEAIETVWRMTGSNTSKNGAKSEGGSVAKGSLQKAIRYAIDLLSGEFTVRDIEDKMRASDPAFGAKIKRASLSAALKRIADDDKKIQLTEAGRGKRPSKYKKVS